MRLIQQLLVQSLHHADGICLPHQEAKIVGAGPVTDEADVDVIQGVEHPAAGAIHLAHAIADQGHQGQILFHPNLAQGTQLRQHGVAEHALAAGLAAGVV